MSERNIVLSDEVSEWSMGNIIKKIHDINSADDEKDDKEKDFVRKPIKLIVNSPGGVVYDGFGLIGAIELSKTPIHTICLGKAMSMGFAILVSGHKRYAHKLSTMMYHEIASWEWGKLEEQKKRFEENNRLQKVYDDYITSKTNITQEQLDKAKRGVHDWFIPADQSLELGVIDEIL